MARYGVQMIDSYSGNVLEIMDEEFDTSEEAEEYCLECSSNFSAGAETLELSGREFYERDEVDFEVIEID